MSFALTRTITHGTIDFLRRLYDVYDRGHMGFTFDYTQRQVTFPRKPVVQEYEEWEIENPDPENGATVLNRQYPAILIRDVAGGLVDMSITGTAPPRLDPFPNEDGSRGDITRPLMTRGRSFGGYLGMDDSLERTQVVVGGGAEFDVSLTVVARTREEAGNLVDVTAIFLAHGYFKDLAHRKYGFEVISAPRIGPLTSVADVATDFRMYMTDLSVPVRGDWLDSVLDVAEIERAFIDIEDC